MRGTWGGQRCPRKVHLQWDTLSDLVLLDGSSLLSSWRFPGHEDGGSIGIALGDHHVLGGAPGGCNNRDNKTDAILLFIHQPVV